MKRFYKSAKAVRVDGEGQETLHGDVTVQLDGRPVRTPARALLTVPTQALGEAIASEWNAQGDKIVKDSMPLMALAATALDRVVPNLAEVALDAARYAGSDLLYYRADAPIELAQRQADAWDPILASYRSALGISFHVTAGIMPVQQPDEVTAEFRAWAESLDPFSLTPVHVMTTALGSLLLARAVFEGRLSAEDAFATSWIDEAYQAELWGLDDEAEARKKRLRSEVMQAAHFLDLLGKPDQTGG